MHSERVLLAVLFLAALLLLLLLTLLLLQLLRRSLLMFAAVSFALTLRALVLLVSLRSVLSFVWLAAARMNALVAMSVRLHRASCSFACHRGACVRVCPSSSPRCVLRYAVCLPLPPPPPPAIISRSMCASMRPL